MREITKKFIVKTWDELTEEEKQHQIEKYSEYINISWGDMLYDDFNIQLSELKSKLKYITFDDVYVEDNSQGWWIDRVKNAEIYITNKNGSIIIDGFDFKIFKYIDKLLEVRIGFDWFTIDELENKKGFKSIIKEIKKDFEMFRDGINDVVKRYFDNLYYVTDDFIENYFDGAEFEFLTD